MRAAERAAFRTFPITRSQIEQQKAEPAQKTIDVREERLIPVDRRELDFDFDAKRRARERLLRAFEHQQLTALRVRLHEIDVVDLVRAQLIVERVR